MPSLEGVSATSEIAQKFVEHACTRTLFFLTLYSQMGYD